MFRIAAVLLALLLFACSRRSEQLDGLFESATASFRNGELQAALDQAERGKSISSPGTADHWKFELLRCEILLARRAAGDVLSILQRPIPDGPEFREIRARRKLLEGQAMISMGKFAEAAPILEEAFARAKNGGFGDILTNIEILEGSRLARLRRWDEAEARLLSAVERARKHRDRYLEAGATVNLGMIRLTRHRFEEAAARFERALALAEGHAQLLYSLALANLSICYYRLGEIDRAIAIQTKAIALHERFGENAYLANTLGEAGSAHALAGRFKESIAFFERAYRLSTKLKRTADAAIWAGNMAAVYAELGDWDSAERWNREAAQLKKQIGARPLVYNILNDARIASGRQDWKRAAALYQQALNDSDKVPAVIWDAHAGLGLVALNRGDASAASRHFAAALKVVEETRSDLLRTDFKISFLGRLIDLYQRAVEALLLQGKQEQALVVADSSRAQVLAERSGIVRSKRYSPEDLKRAAARRNAVVLSYWLTPQGFYVWVVTPEEIRLVKLAPVTEIAPLVEEFREAVQRHLADPAATPLRAGDRLYQLVVEPVQDWVAKARSVIIVPDGPLQELNFETLPVPGKSRYWIEDVEVSVAPSVAMLADSRPASRKARSILVIGDPVPEDPAYPKLAHAAREIDSILAAFPSIEKTVYVGSEATPAAYRKANPSQFSFIHFAAHAVANRESPLDSAVLLTGNKLYARDVMDLPLNADLVTVSACRGAGSRIYSGEGLVGFAWAFQRAGARNVVAGVWDVNDRSTALLMKELYAGIAQGQTPAKALRGAKLKLMASSPNFHKPYYWGAFQLYISGN